MQRGDVDRWLTAYIEAWRTYDRDRIGALFSADAEYRYHPYDPPVRGSDAIVGSWLGESGAQRASTPDEPGTWGRSTGRWPSTATPPWRPAARHTSPARTARSTAEAGRPAGVDLGP
jgi:hypothetical protein